LLFLVIVDIFDFFSCPGQIQFIVFILNCLTLR